MRKVATANTGFSKRVVHFSCRGVTSPSEHVLQAQPGPDLGNDAGKGVSLSAAELVLKLFCFCFLCYVTLPEL